MRRRWKVFLFGGCLVAAAGLWLFLSLNSEPSYQGKRLSQWVMELDLGREGGRFSPEHVNALNAIGTNAIPYLLKWVRYDTPRWKAAWYNRVNSLRMRLFKKEPVYDQGQLLGNKAMLGLWHFRSFSPIEAECRRLVQDTNTPWLVRCRVDWVGFQLDPNAAGPKRTNQ